MSFWQGAGNGKGFDSFLGDNSKMNNRTIGVLSYIKYYRVVNENQFQNEIKQYLLTNFNENPNDSLDTHFYKPALFYGLIQKDFNNNLSLSIEGNLFLNSYFNRNYLECQKIIINQLDNTTYPNMATPNIQELNLFPFRILFKLLLEQGSLSQDFINNSLVRITNINDLNLYRQTGGNLNNINSFQDTSSKFTKFNTWVISSLVDIGILYRYPNKSIQINNYWIKYVHNMYNSLTYENCFFENRASHTNQKVAKKRYPRNQQLIQSAKNRDNFTCQINYQHSTFISKGNNYVEGHHIIPMFQQKNYSFQLDDVNNIISLCPNCHREIHSADDKINILNRLYYLNENYMQNNNIVLNDLYKMYN